MVPIDPDSLDNTLAFDVEFSQGFVAVIAVVAAVGPTICPDSFANTLAVGPTLGPDSSNNTLAFDVKFSQGFFVAAVGSTICPNSCNNTLDHAPDAAVATLNDTQDVAVAMPLSPVVCPDVSDDFRCVSEPRERLDVVGIWHVFGPRERLDVVDVWHVFGPAGYSDEVVGLRLPSGDDVATRRVRLDIGERGLRCQVVLST